MQDYSEYLINAQKLIRGIGDSANKNDYKKAFELAYHLGELSEMLKESLVKIK
jgi:Zn finger protein HypA/HybF involved in hydrogenase expression